MKILPEAWRAPGPVLLLAVIVALLGLRLASLGSYPLMDTSEARYGEIARVMLTTGNYVTPQEVPGTPFWAKPPLYAWLSVASMRLLGIGEFPLRLPSLLCALGVLLLSAGWAASLGSTRGGAVRQRAALLAGALLAGFPGFYGDAGAVMTDPGLALCSTAMLACFHQVVLRGRRSLPWRYGFFAAAGLGMLAKGPVVMLYAGLPIVLWTLWQRRLAAVFSALPWLTGTLLAALICVPWYLLAERQTPGFLNYFLLGEHVMRFLKPGWTGDRYGTAHAEPLGTIWLYLALAIGLSTLLALAVLAAALRRRVGAAGAPRLDAEQRLLVLAVLVPVVFFSFAGNIIWTYVVPALGPLAVLLADALAERVDHAGWRNAVGAVLLLSTAALFVLTLTLVPAHFSAHSSAGLIARWQDQQSAAPGDIVYLGRRVPASLRFYSRGTVSGIADPAQALAGIAAGGVRYLALPPAALDDLQRYASMATPPLRVQAVAANKDLALVKVRVAEPSPPPPPPPLSRGERGD